MHPRRSPSPITVCHPFAASLLLAALTTKFFPPVVAVGSSFNRKVISTLSDLPHDKNGRLSSHVLAYYPTARSDCDSFFESELPVDGEYSNMMYHHLPIAVEGDAAIALFGDDGDPGLQIDDDDDDNNDDDDVARRSSLCPRRPGRGFASRGAPPTGRLLRSARERGASIIP